MGLKTTNKIDYFIYEFQIKYPTIQNVDNFFISNLSKISEIKESQNLHDQAMDFVEEYKKYFSGSNALYGYLYHAYIEFYTSIKGLDLMEIYSEINKK